MEKQGAVNFREQLDAMFGGRGYYLGSSVMVSGTAGSGKSSVASSFADDTCRRGRRCLYWSLEESAGQLLRNMASIGIDLGRHARSGLLAFHTVRPTLYGLEGHLVTLHGLVERFKPFAVIVDPVSNLDSIGNEREIKAMLTRMIDFLKNRGVTSLFTALTADDSVNTSTAGISSLIDTWIQLRMVESANERNRLLYLLKSRGMGHSNQMREFVMTGSGIDLVDVYTGPGAVYTGTERINQMARDRAAELAARRDAERRVRALERERAALESQIATLQAGLADIASQCVQGESEEIARMEMARSDREKIIRARRVDVAGTPGGGDGPGAR